eukprot:1948190-Rhodomonas_salina.1
MGSTSCIISLHPHPLALTNPPLSSLPCILSLSVSFLSHLPTSLPQQLFLSSSLASSLSPSSLSSSTSGSPHLSPSPGPHHLPPPDPDPPNNPLHPAFQTDASYELCLVLQTQIVKLC